MVNGNIKRANECVKNYSLINVIKCNLKNLLRTLRGITSISLLPI